MDYELGPIGSRGFEHLVQALALGALGPGIEVFGDGPDGGREATFQGEVPIPHYLGGGHWFGYGVLQAKHLLHETDEPIRSARWLVKQLRAELNAYLPEGNKPPKRAKAPEYYIITTNVRLSPGDDDGGIKLVEAELEKYAEALNLRGFAIWHYDQIARLLDNNSEVRKTYAGVITSGDLISVLLELFQDSIPDIGKQVSVNAAVELRERQWSRLSDSGLDHDGKLPLDQVAIDLPTKVEGVDSDDSDVMAVKHILELGSESHRRSERETGAGSLLIGGPGQGKSTVAQIVCQAYRAALLASSSALNQEQQRLVDANHASIERMGLEIPKYRRWPVYVELSKFGDELAALPDRTLLAYIASLVRADGSSLKANQLMKWRKSWPWLVVLDGLDEVAALGVRQGVVSAVNEFITEVNFSDDDIMILATTRPQGYSGEFGEFDFEQMNLRPLEPAEATRYGHRLTQLRLADDPLLKSQVDNRLADAANAPASSKLMTSPLQVTIMTTLLEVAQRVPDTRHALFDAYYQAIYGREIGRAGRLGELLARFRPVVDHVHEQVGLYLQRRAENAGQAEALLSEAVLRQLFVDRLESDGHGDEATALADELVQASRLRVVLIVGAQRDLVGFEVRILQEYMAARALTNAADDQVLIALDAILPSAHWRTTWLLAAGRVLSNTPRLVDDLLQIVREADHRTASARIVRSGQRVALDLLEDDFAANVPRVRAGLLQQAVEAVNAWPQRSLRRLARVVSTAAAAGSPAGKRALASVESAFKAGGRSRASAVLMLQDWGKQPGSAGATSKRLLVGNEWRPDGSPPQSDWASLGGYLASMDPATDDENEYDMDWNRLLQSFDGRKAPIGLTSAQVARYAKQELAPAGIGFLDLLEKSDLVLNRLRDDIDRIPDDAGAIAVALCDLVVIVDERRTSAPGPIDAILDYPLIEIEKLF